MSAIDPLSVKAEPNAADRAEARPSSHMLRRCFWVLLGWTVPAMLVWTLADRLDLGTTAYGFNIYWYLVLHHEPVAWLVLLLGVVLGCATLARPDGSAALRIAQALQRPFVIPALALLAGAAFALGNVAVYHRYRFSMDEFAPLFQAKIFLNGAIKATIPEAWREYGAALRPIFIKYDPGAHTWTSSYLPVHAALQAGFLALGAPDLLNPLLGAASVLLTADVAKRVFPEWRYAPIVAVTLLITSTQFLLNSISYYSMPAHLCANLLWLSLYLRNTRASLALAPWIGGLAMGLHQIVVHALFVLPFLLRLVLTRRFGASTYFGIVYLGFFALWNHWQKITMHDGVAQRAATLFDAPDFTQVLTQVNNLTLVFSWQSAAVAFFLVGAILRYRRMRPACRDLLLGLLTTLLFYSFYKSNQGHGWGSRYMYGVLGNVILLATFGWTRLARAVGEGKGLRMVAVSTAFALLVQVPMRLVQAERVIRPFAAARDHLATFEDEIVVLDYRAIWYGQDLVRNDPFLSKGQPIMLHWYRLPLGSPSQRKLQNVRWIDSRELADLGMIVRGHSGADAE